jgi:hypothetical protein
MFSLYLNMHAESLTYMADQRELSFERFYSLELRKASAVIKSGLKSRLHG